MVEPPLGSSRLHIFATLEPQPILESGTWKRFCFSIDSLQEATSALVPILIYKGQL